MRKRVLTLIVALSLAIGVSGCNGESVPPHGIVEGIVTDQVTGRPVRGVWVMTGSTVAWTNASGSYWLSLQEGTHSICFYCAGYTRKSLSVTVHGGSTVEASLQMNPILPAGPMEIPLAAPPWAKLD